jgi:hypothetical protein
MAAALVYVQSCLTYRYISGKKKGKGCDAILYNYNYGCLTQSAPHPPHNTIARETAFQQTKALACVYWCGAPIPIIQLAAFYALRCGTQWLSAEDSITNGSERT